MASYDHTTTPRKAPPAVTSLSELPWTRIVVSVVGMLLAMLLAALDQTIVATALPRVVADLGGFGQFAWLFSSYMLASTVSIPIMGKLSDVYGRKSVLVGGLLIFMAGSALSGGAQDMTQLILFRGIQGVGAGSIIANSYAVLGDVFPPAQRGKWTGVVVGVFALAIVIGPTAGGYVTDHFGWRWIFFLNLPAGLVALLVILGGMADVRDPRVSSRIDYPGVTTFIASVVTLLLALTWVGKEFPWGSPLIVGLFLFSGIMAVLFLWIQARTEEALIPRSLFSNPIFSVAVVATFLTAIVMYGGIMFIPLFVQGVIGSSATSAGMVLIPMMLSAVVSAVVAGQIISRTGHYRILAITGVSVMALGIYLFTRLDAQSSSTEAVQYLVVAGAGLGATLPTFMIAVQNAFPHHTLGVVTASLQFFRNLGGAVGTAVLGAFMTLRLGDWLSNSSPPEAVAALPPQVIEQLRDSQALMNPAAMSQLRELAGQQPNVAEALTVIEEGLRAALAGAMHDVFILGLGITLVAVLVTIFFKDIPLRRTNRDPEGS